MYLYVHASVITPVTTHVLALCATHQTYFHVRRGTTESKKKAQAKPPAKQAAGKKRRSKREDSESAEASKSATSSEDMQESSASEEEHTGNCMRRVEQPTVHLQRTCTQHTWHALSITARAVGCGKLWVHLWRLHMQFAAHELLGRRARRSYISIKQQLAVAALSITADAA